MDKSIILVREMEIDEEDDDGEEIDTTTSREKKQQNLTALDHSKGGAGKENDSEDENEDDADNKTIEAGNPESQEKTRPTTEQSQTYMDLHLNMNKVKDNNPMAAIQECINTCKEWLEQIQ